MGIKDEINNNHISSAYGNVKNSSLLKKANSVKTQSVKIESVYKANDYSKAGDSSTKPKTQTLSSLVKSFALVASALVLGELGLSTFSAPTVQVEEMYVESYETGVYYYVEFSDFSDDLTIVLKNDFTNRVNKVEEQSVDGGFENLAPNMKYSFIIKQGNKVVAKKSVETKRNEREFGQNDRPYYDDNGNGNYDSGGN